MNTLEELARQATREFIEEFLRETDTRFIQDVHAAMPPHINGNGNSYTVAQRHYEEFTRNQQQNAQRTVRGFTQQLMGTFERPVMYVEHSPEAERRLRATYEAAQDIQIWGSDRSFPPRVKSEKVNWKEDGF